MWLAGSEGRRGGSRWAPEVDRGQRSSWTRLAWRWQRGGRVDGLRMGLEKFLLSVPTETGQRQERMLRKLQAQQPSFGKSPLKGGVSTNKPLELSASYSHTCYQEKAGKMVVAKTASSKHLSSKFDSFTTFNRCLTERGLLVYYI